MVLVEVVGQVGREAAAQVRVEAQRAGRGHAAAAEVQQLLLVHVKAAIHCTACPLTPLIHCTRLHRVTSRQQADSTCHSRVLVEDYLNLALVVRFVCSEATPPAPPTTQRRAHPARGRGVLGQRGGGGEAGREGAEPARAASVFVFDPPGDRPSQVWPISEWENGRFYEGPVIRF